MTAHYIVPPCRETITELYRDKHIIVINKPAGLLSVPGKPPNDKDSALGRLQRIDPETRVVHRLDMSTSGLMVFGVGAGSHRHLSRQFQDRKVRKGYVAEVWNTPGVPKGEIDLPLRCDWPNRPRQMVDHVLGKSSQTLYTVIENHRTLHSRIWLEPITGRSHQLRVHMAELGHPILGCEFYAHPEAKAAADRLHLHASMLCFQHPVSEQNLTFNSSAPF